MRELVGSKNTIGQPATVLKKPNEATFMVSSLACLVVPYFTKSQKRAIILGGKKLLNIKFLFVCLFVFESIVCNGSHSNRNSSRLCHKVTFMYSRKVPVIFCQIVIKIEFSWKIFEKLLKY